MWVALISALIEAAAEYYEKHSTEDWQNSVSSKLNEILTKLEEIHQFLLTLPDVIVGALKEEQRQLWITQLRAQITDINDLIAPQTKPTSAKDRQKRIADVFDRTKTLLEENMDYSDWGFSQFAVVATGFSALIGLASLERDKALFKAIISHGLDYYRKAIDGAVPTSFGAEFAASSNTKSTIASSTDPLFNTWWNTGRGDSIDQSPRALNIHWDYVFIVHGSVSLGITQVNRDQWSKSAPLFPGTNGSDADQQAINILNARIDEWKVASSRMDTSQICIDLCNKVLVELTKLA